MKLYYSKGACSLVVRIILNELGLSSEYESVDLKTKKTEKGQDFFSINPKGAVPVLQTDKGEIMTENAVILQFLADSTKASLLPPLSDFKRYRVLEWINYLATELHKGIGILFNPALTEDVKQKIFIPLIRRKLNYVNQELGTKTYLLGEQFTLPDAYLFVLLLWCVNLKIDLSEFSALQSYQAALSHRKSIETSLKQEGIHFG